MQENNTSSAQAWGLRHDITPSLGARLVQEGCRLHYLTDRSNIQGSFTTEQAAAIKQKFPLFIEYLESMLRIRELKPACQHLVSVSFGGFICEADTRGSCGYVYVTIYPAK